MNNLSLEDIQSAQNRIQNFITKTPILERHIDINGIKHKIFFKAENQQVTGAFKARGAVNAVLWLKETNALPKKIVAYSSGNHAQALAWVCQKLEVPCEIYMPQTVLKNKIQATKKYGAKVFLFPTRQEAEDAAMTEVNNGAYLIPPYDHDQVICGQGTACLEALNQINESVDAIFAPCGGGGLLSGTLIVANALHPNTQVIGAEPLKANDAARSLRENKIFRWKDTPTTIADGARTLGISDKTFQYLKQLNAMYEISEEEITKWTTILQTEMDILCEPTSALAMAAAHKYLLVQTKPTNVLSIISGGNI